MTLQNKRFANGRIHASDKMDADYSNGYIAHTVSPYEKNFDEEVEPGVRNHLKVLIEKGYLPISSCEGHHSFKTHMNWYIMMAFGGNRLTSIQDRIYKTIKHCQNVPGVFFEIRHSVNNTNKALNKRVSLRNDQQEIQYYNKLFLQSNKYYMYLYIGLYKNVKGSYTKELWRLFNERFSKNKLLKLFRSLPDEHIN